MSVGDNERRIKELKEAVDDCVLERLCEERNGRIMDAVDRLNETTRDLSGVVDRMQSERRTDRGKLALALAGWLSAAILGILFVLLKRGG